MKTQEYPSTPSAGRTMTSSPVMELLENLTELGNESKKGRRAPPTIMKIVFTSQTLRVPSSALGENSSFTKSSSQQVYVNSEIILKYSLSSNCPGCPGIVFMAVFRNQDPVKLHACHSAIGSVESLNLEQPLSAP